VLVRGEMVGRAQQDHGRWLHHKHLCSDGHQGRRRRFPSTGPHAHGRFCGATSLATVGGGQLLSSVTRAGRADRPNLAATVI
jgi:hypothetical protein